jgi:hypothetical protein
MVKRKGLIGKSFSEVANLMHPNVPFDYKHVLEYINGGYIIEFIPDDPEDQDKTVQLKGMSIIYRKIYSSSSSITHLFTSNHKALGPLLRPSYTYCTLIFGMSFIFFLYIRSDDPSNR